MVFERKTTFFFFLIRKKIDPPTNKSENRKLRQTRIRYPQTNKQTDKQTKSQHKSINQRQALHWFLPEGKNVSDWIFFLWGFEDDILKSLATSFGI